MKLFMFYNLSVPYEEKVPLKNCILNNIREWLIAAFKQLNMFNCIIIVNPMIYGFSVYKFEYDW